MNVVQGVANFDDQNTTDCSLSASYYFLMVHIVTRVALGHYNRSDTFLLSDFVDSVV